MDYKQEYINALQVYEEAKEARVKWIREVYKPERAKYNKAQSDAKGKRDHFKYLCKKHGIDISNI